VIGVLALAAEAVARLSAETQTFPAGAVWIACEDLRGPEGLAEVWNRIARALDAPQRAALFTNARLLICLGGVPAVPPQ
jgi:hypothetical protein